MIRIDANLSYLTDHYNIGAQQLTAYRGMSLTEIMKIESERGNEKAAHFLSNILSNPSELVKIFQLLKPENRYEIIRNMSFSDKIKMMQELTKKQKLMGLQFFKKDKLIDMLKDVNKKDLLNIGLQKFDFEDYMKNIPEKQMDKFFDSEEIKPKQIMQGVQTLEPEQLSRMIENVTGEAPKKDTTKKEMLATLSLMKPKTLKKAVKSMEKDEKGQIMAGMAKEDPKVLKELSPEGFVGPLEKLDKKDLLEAMSVLEEKDISKMLTELPEDLMAVTASQIPAEDFAKVLINDFSDVLEKVCI